MDEHIVMLLVAGITASKHRDHGWSGLPLNPLFHPYVGDAVEQHGTGAGRHVAVFSVETERHLTGIENDTRGAQT